MPELPDVAAYLSSLETRIVGQPLERIRLTSALLDAMNTGHRGTLATIHASSAEETIHRVATLVMRGSSGQSIDAIKDDVRRGIDLIVYIHREQGERRVHDVLDLAAH